MKTSIKSNNTPIIDIEDDIKGFIVRLKYERRRQGITQKKLSELSNISPRTISFIESFTTNPSLYNIMSICKALNLEIKISHK